MLSTRFLKDPFKEIVRKFSNSTNKQVKKVFSGIQPTGNLHLGNYFGAVKRWIDLQNSNYDVTYCIVDLHSITLPQKPLELKENILRICATLLACGIDPQKSTLFLQSSVREHSELCWILSCNTTMARLTHLPQYKEKSEKMKEIPLGLYLYPVLQAADIMLHKANLVPVGEDQIQHIQLAQSLTKNFNHRFGPTFPTCEPMISEDLSSRIKSLRDPTKKMSKSDPDPKSCVMLTDSPDQITSKIKKAVTDFTSAVTFDPQNRQGVANLLTIHSLASNKSIEQICDESQRLDTGQYKFKVAEAIIEHFNPIRLKIDDYLKNPDYLWSILDIGNEKAQEVAEKTMNEIILLFLFLGGGIFYGLKVWQGTALGCPEPIIQEVKHHDGIIPYHSHFSDISYSAPPPDAFGGYNGFSGYSGADIGGIYSNTPASPSFNGPTGFSNGAAATGSGASVGTIDAGSVVGPSNTYLPPSSRRRRVSGNARSDSSSESISSMFTDLMFRFLGVNTDSCKRRFVCELEFRNPFVGYAMNYIGNDLFSEFRMEKNSPESPKKFSDCAKLYADCEVPKEHTFATKKRRRYYLKKRLNQTTVEEKEETTINPNNDLVTKYVKNQE
ncbi:hypothetical protein PVAND_011189 [Polypedilum vanderplanki]|uniref:tryptophan--tRNA ligase n=1 Tax=Polypedilum vanderplanki TaxID=319348 RepID=A0A9J6CIJ2_POLVA|nr:hypothetical protein PVAND_011189 [Polypedilum vanderplanki]